jgi:hypothetical protein
MEAEGCHVLVTENRARRSQGNVGDLERFNGSETGGHSPLPRVSIEWSADLDPARTAQERAAAIRAAIGQSHPDHRYHLQSTRLRQEAPVLMTPDRRSGCGRRKTVH